MEKELKLINWFLDEFRKSDKKEISTPIGFYDMNLGMYGGHIDNMSFDLTDKKLVLASVRNLFEDKYDINLEYKIMYNKNLDYFITELGKETMSYNVTINDDALDNFLNTVEMKEEMKINDYIIIKVAPKYKEFMDKDENYKYLDNSRIDGQLIYQIKIELPDFELIHGM